MGMISSFYSNVYGYQRKKKRTKAQRLVSKRRKMPYRKFLLSAYWQEVRELVLGRDGSRCKLCATASRLEVHHIVYDHRGDEKNHLHELVTLCHECHSRIHAAA